LGEAQNMRDFAAAHAHLQYIKVTPTAHEEAHPI
jgi:hypothetical protein